MDQDRYSNYIRSTAWKKKRLQAFRKYGRRCYGCGNRAKLQIHHKTYIRFTREKLADLLVLCETCHEKVHDFHRNRNTEGLSLWRATEKVVIELREKAKKTGGKTLPKWEPDSLTKFKTRKRQGKNSGGKFQKRSRINKENREDS